MIGTRYNMEIEYYRDMILNTGFDITNEANGQMNVNALINANDYTDSEFSCDCGTYTGRDLLGQTCPRCRTEITLRSLNFKKTGWLNLSPHKVLTPVYYNILKRVLGNNMLRFILGDYKHNKNIEYTSKDDQSEKEETKPEPEKKRRGRISNDSLEAIIAKIPKNKLKWEGLGHDGFYENFEEIVTSCMTKNNVEDIRMLLSEKEIAFTSKVPVYSTAFRPVSKTSESFFYPKINRFYAQMCAVTCQMGDMYIKEEQIDALNSFQKYWLDAADHLISNEMAEKSGLVRSEIVGGTFEFSARGVIILDTTLGADEIDIPFTMLMTLMKYKVAHRLHIKYNMTLEQAYLMINNNRAPNEVDRILRELVDEGIWLMMIREPTNNIASNCLVKVRNFKYNDDTISISEPVLTGLNADFDGDQLNMFGIPNELLKYWWQFHLSCFIDPVSDKISIHTKEWSAVNTALITM